MLISIIIPCYNEENTIAKILEKIKAVNIKASKEIIVVDDYSTDRTREILKDYEGIKVVYHEKNFGKGKAIRSGLKKVSGDIILIQDADLEYNPDDYGKLIKPFVEANADVVFGSRFLGGGDYYRVHFFWHYLANKILTFFTNIVTNLNMTDMETGYKVFKSNCIKSDELEQNSFGIEPEITIKLAKKKLKFFEVPVSYNGRTYEEGKKIHLKDAFIAVYCIIKYAFK